MKTAIGLFIASGFVAALLTLDAATQSHVVINPQGFEAAMVIPGFVFLLGALCVVVASILTLIHLKREKIRFVASKAAWSCVLLIVSHVALLFAHP